MAGGGGGGEGGGDGGGGGWGAGAGAGMAGEGGGAAEKTCDAASSSQNSGSASTSASHVTIVAGRAAWTPAHVASVKPIPRHTTLTAVVGESNVLQADIMSSGVIDEQMASVAGSGPPFASQYAWNVTPPST